MKITFLLLKAVPKSTVKLCSFLKLLIFGLLFVFYFSKLSNYQTLQVKRKAKLRRWLIYWERHPRQSLFAFYILSFNSILFQTSSTKVLSDINFWWDNFFPLYDNKFPSLLQNEKKKYSPPIFYSFVTKSYSEPLH